MAVISKQICLSDITQGGVSCTNPTVTWEAGTGVVVNCEDGSCSCVNVDFIGDGQHCVIATIKCDDCADCPDQVKQICLCENSDDCGECEFCSGGLCTSVCPEGKLCDNDTCVDCLTSDECECDQQCVQGSCVCPAETPYKGFDGCCVECDSAHPCPPCYVCLDGTCVAKVCPDGVCNPSLDQCAECYDSSQCTNPNECCQADGTCDCCEGYFLDPSGNCVPEPECFGVQDCIEQFGECYFCDNGECVPVNCPNGFICVDGDCVPSCEDGICPEGQGCINGTCIPCEQLSCDTSSGLQCVFATGCECIGTTCTAIDCDVTDVDLEWVISPSTPGTITNPGQPQLTGSWNITPGAVTTSPPIYRNFTFNLSVTNGGAGTWTLFNNPSIGQVIGSGNSVTFDLTSTGPNLVGFVVKYVETATGRTAQFGVFSNPSLPLDDINLFNNSQVQFSSTGVPPTTVGGTTGNVQLCANNGNFALISATGGAISGDITITFSQLGNGCLLANILGCGTWVGEAIAQCGGVEVVIPIPEFTKDPANCCQPTDPNCGGDSQGEPCITPTVTNITLTARPSYGTNGSGDGEFVITADWASAGLSFFDLFFLNIGPNCWSTSNNPASSNNDILINGGGPLGVSPSPLSVYATMGDGGCVNLGKSCNLQISGCRRLEGQVCLDECTNFSVYIADLGTNNYTAWPSQTDEPVSYTWTLNSVFQGTGQSINIPPVGGNNTITVTARYGNPNPPGKCSATDTITNSVTISGCTNPQACNYDSTANVDNGSCCVLSGLTYNCTTGLQEGVISTSCVGTRTYDIGGTIYSVGDPVPSGTYTVTPYLNGLPCSATFPFTVPQCYMCSGTTCIGSTPNLGQFTEPTCGTTCECLVDLNILAQCTGNRFTLTLQPSGGTGVYTIIVRENNATGTIIYNQSGVVSPVVISNLCVKNYHISVNDGACIETFSYTPPCDVCTNTTMNISGVSFECPDGGNPAQVTFNITGDNCVVGSYTVNVTGAGYARTQTFGSAGVKVMQLVPVPPDGTYTISVSAVLNGITCTKSTTFLANCTGGACIFGPVTLVVATGAPGFANGTVTWSQVNGSGTVNYSLHSATASSGGCGGADCSTYAFSGAIRSGSDSTGTISLPNLLEPLNQTCYRINLTDSVTGTCTAIDYFCYNPAAAPMACTIDVTSVIYNEPNESFFIEWNSVGTASGPSNGLAVDFVVWDTAVCGVGTSATFTYTGLGEFSSGPVEFGIGDFPDIPANAQCVTVNVYDPIEPSCTETSLDGSIPACSCTVSIDSVTFGTDELIIDYSSDCTTPPTSLLFQIDEYSDPAFTVFDSNLGNPSVSTESGILFFPITQGPLDRYIRIQLEDATIGACVDVAFFTVPACVACASQFVDVPAGTFQQVEDVDTTVYIVNLPCECVADATASANNDAVAADIEAELTAVDTCGVPVVTWASLAETTATCLRESNTFNGIVSTTGDQEFCRVTINGTPYDTSIVFATWAAGEATETVGAELAIATFIAESLNAEGVPFLDVEVEVSVAETSPDSVTFAGLIRGIDVANTITWSRTTASTTCPGSTFAFGADCTAVTGTTVTNYGECIRFTVAGSGIILNTATVSSPELGTDDYIFDTTSC